MNDELIIVLYGEQVGTLRRESMDSYRLDYFPEYRSNHGSIPLSLSLPLSSPRHTGSTVWNYVDNLLPDNPVVRERWATKAGLTTIDPFGLLSHYGQDVAGAASFLRPDLPSLSSRVPLEDDEIAERIRTARGDAAAWHDDNREAEGQFSLAGAQTKFSLALHDGRWYETAGADPSTHIFKPQVTGVSDGEIVEYVIMRTAAALGIPTAQVDLVRFGDEHSLVVERFDRESSSDFPRRHQEDMAQSLALPRLRKYERDGGPSLDVIAQHLSRYGGPYAAESRRRFAQSLAFSWIVLNTDAHTKNYSVLLDPEGALLSPLYDVSSIIPYLGPTGLDTPSFLARAADRTLAMRYGASFRAGDASGFEIGAIARACGMRSHTLIETTAAYCLAIPNILQDIVASMRPSFHTETVSRLVEWMPLRASQAVSSLKGFL